ncbi:hypothetical protein JCM3770_006062 [Rhodotorula araucariae]
MDSLAVSESYLSDSGSSTSSSASRAVPLTSSAFDGVHTPAPPLPPSLPALVLHKLVAAELERNGFDAAAADALDECEGVVAEFLASLTEYAHALAELGRRHVPSAADVVAASEALGAGGAGALLGELRRTRRRDAPPTAALQITYTRARVPTPPGPLLASDDEDDGGTGADALASPPPTPPLSPLAPLDDDDDDDDAEFEEVLPLSLSTAAAGAGAATKQSAAAERRAARAAQLSAREAAAAQRRAERERRRRERRRRDEADPLRASWLPALPPKHSWKQTPVYPQSAPPPPLPPPISRTQQAPSAIALAHLSTLRARLNDSQLVSSSLRNLIRRTRGAAAGGAGAGAAGDAAGEGADVVDYEGEWYGASAAGGVGAGPAGGGGGGKRRVRVLTVGGAGGSDDEDAAREEERERARKEAGVLGGGGRGAGKRRRWLV